MLPRSSRAGQPTGRQRGWVNEAVNQSMSLADKTAHAAAVRADGGQLVVVDRRAAHDTAPGSGVGVAVLATMAAASHCRTLLRSVRSASIRLADRTDVSADTST